jgi:hydrophobe/amphiphile efflux-1 (HAE1) family protein
MSFPAASTSGAVASRQPAASTGENHIATDISSVFIFRPVATTLLAIALMLAGILAYPFLPVANMPAVEFPTMRITATRPGADPATMAASIAAPLERTLGALAGVREITSTSTTGRTRISIQFALERAMDDVARDVQAALNAAVPELPADLPSLPSVRKFNPAARPILVLAMKSKSLSTGELYDLADTLVAQRISKVRGIGDVTVSGGEQPAIRIQADPSKIASMGLSLATIRDAIANAGEPVPLGVFDGSGKRETLSINSPRLDPLDFAQAVVQSKDGKIIRLGDVASVTVGVRNDNSAGWYNAEPAIIMMVTQEPGANVIQAIAGVRDIMPEVRKLLPAGVELAILSDRAQTIRASVHDMEKTLGISILLVTLVVFLFLRRLAATLAAAIAVPLSMAGTFGAMWILGFSIDNLSLMAITIAIGFVIDDAIVMIENIHRTMATGVSGFQAALVGARQIGFTVVSISLSLIAAFIPLLFMPGIIGRVFHEFSIVIAIAILISMVVSLTVTPVICAYFLHEQKGRKETILGRAVEWVLRMTLAGYGRSLRVSLRHPWFMLALFAAVLAMTVQLYRVTPKGFFPRTDSGTLFVWFEAGADSSFTSMAPLARQAVQTVMADAAVESVATFVGSGLSVNSGRMLISLKPIEVRKIQAQAVAQRLRRQLARVGGLSTWVFPGSDIRVGARQSRSVYQFTLASADIDGLFAAARKAEARLKEVPEITEVASDLEQGGLQAKVVIDRKKAGQLGVKIKDISDALSNAFSQRQITTIYGERNQYKVVLEIPKDRRREPGDLAGLYVPGAGGVQIPLQALARVEQSVATISVDHHGSYPSVTITYDLAKDVLLDTATTAVENAIHELNLPDHIRADFAGDAKEFKQNSRNQLWLILAALVAVYLILGILYESLIHPLTIISTLPSAGLGALIALNSYKLDLSLVAFIGIIMLIGIVKKNGIMMVDFAISAERTGGLSPRDAVYEACLKRFRPILMTTLAAMCGALPLMLSTGPGSELRIPLGVTVVGGLLLSQILTLYTTPSIYLLMSRFTHSRGASRMQRLMMQDASVAAAPRPAHSAPA